MEQVRKAQKRYASAAIILAICIGSAFFIFGLKPIGKGLILGTIFSIMNFIIMGETLPMRIGKTRNKAMVLSFISILARYLMLAVPIYLSIRHELFNLPAVICGLFMVQCVILADEIFHRLHFSNLKKNTSEKLLWKN